MQGVGTLDVAVTGRKKIATPGSSTARPDRTAQGDRSLFPFPCRGAWATVTGGQVLVGDGDPLVGSGRSAPPRLVGLLDQGSASTATRSSTGSASTATRSSQHGVGQHGFPWRVAQSTHVVPVPSASSVTSAPTRRIRSRPRRSRRVVPSGSGRSPARGDGDHW